MKRRLRSLEAELAQPRGEASDVGGEERSEVGALGGVGAHVVELELACRELGRSCIVAMGLSHCGGGKAHRVAINVQGSAEASRDA